MAVSTLASLTSLSSKKTSPPGCRGSALLLPSPPAIQLALLLLLPGLPIALTPAEIPPIHSRPRAGADSDLRNLPGGGAGFATPTGYRLTDFSSGFTGRTIIEVLDSSGVETTTTVFVFVASHDEAPFP